MNTVVFHLIGPCLFGLIVVMLIALLSINLDKPISILTTVDWEWCKTYVTAPRRCNSCVPNPTKCRERVAEITPNGAFSVSSHWPAATGAPCVRGQNRALSKVYSFSPSSTVMRQTASGLRRSGWFESRSLKSEEAAQASTRTRAFAATVSPKPPLIRSFSSCSVSKDKTKSWL